MIGRCVTDFTEDGTVRVRVLHTFVPIPKSLHLLALASFTVVALPT